MESHARDGKVQYKARFGCEQLEPHPAGNSGSHVKHAWEGGSWDVNPPTLLESAIGQRVLPRYISSLAFCWVGTGSEEPWGGQQQCQLPAHD